jgi:putative ABC transport system ATP-binding protein
VVTNRTHDNVNSAVPAVRVKGVTKTFGKGDAAVAALRGVNMTIPQGQLIMLVGPSGCGKTTLLSIISGVLDADAGEVDIFGQPWVKLSTDKKTKLRAELVGFVFQQFNLIPTLTAAENAAVPLVIQGMSLPKALKHGQEALASVGLGDRAGSMPAQLSGGQQQRVAIARALAGRPRLLVCDEPTANLDAKTGQQVMEIVRNATREVQTDNNGREFRRTVIVVTHDPRIFHYADRIEEMEDGRLKDHPSEFVMQEAKWVPHYDNDADAAPAAARPPQNSEPG